jgi:hypothetical protein
MRSSGGASASPPINLSGLPGQFVRRCIGAPSFRRGSPLPVWSRRGHTVRVVAGGVERAGRLPAPTIRAQLRDGRSRPCSRGCGTGPTAARASRAADRGRQLASDKAAARSTRAAFGSRSRVFCRAWRSNERRPRSNGPTGALVGHARRSQRRRSIRPTVAQIVRPARRIAAPAVEVLWRKAGTPLAAEVCA